MNLVVLTNIFTPYRMPLFEALARRVERFTVLLMAEQEANRQWELGAPTFAWETLPGFHLCRGNEAAAHVNSGVLRALRRLNPDAVIGGGYTLANMTALLYCKVYGKRYIGWAHLTLQDGAERSFVRRVVRRAMIWASDGHIAESSEAKRAFVHYGADPNRVLTALMPFDVEGMHRRTLAIRQTAASLARRAEYAGPVLVSIGQMIPRKGVMQMLHIYEWIVAERPEVSLVFVGDGPERARYREYAASKGWAHVHFVGYVQQQDLPQYLAIADLFVFHTLYDPFGLVLSEAMATETPVVSSVHACSTLDLVDDGITGFRIDPDDAPASARTLLHAIEMSGEQRALLGRAGYERVKLCDADPSAEAMVGFLHGLTAGTVSGSVGSDASGATASMGGRRG